MRRQRSPLYPRDLYGVRQPLCISDPKTWFRRGRKRFKKEHKRILTESFMRSRLQRGRMDFFFFFWIVLCTQVLNNHQFDHLPNLSSNCYSSHNNTLSRYAIQYLFGSPDFTRVGTLVPTDKENRNLDHYKLASWIATEECKSEVGTMHREDPTMPATPSAAPRHCVSHSGFCSRDHSSPTRDL